MTFCDQAKVKVFIHRGQAAQKAVDATLDLFGEPQSAAAPRKKKTGYAAIPGTGPKNETCGTCDHCYFTRSVSGKRFNKCDLVKETHGSGTDIRRKSQACWHFVKTAAKEAL
jgi:hypothetical protein